jgi:hypothetical protein
VEVGAGRNEKGKGGGRVGGKWGLEGMRRERGGEVEAGRNEEGKGGGSGGWKE